MKAKKTIQERINRLEALQYLVDTAESRIDYLEKDAHDYYEQCLDEEGKITDESSWQYGQYLEQSERAQAMRNVLEEIENLAD